MKLASYVSCLALFTFAQASGQGLPEVHGAAATATGGATTARADISAVSANPAGLSELSGTTFITAISNRFHFAPFTTASAGAAWQTRYGGFGVIAQRFGDEVFSISRAGAGFAHRMGITSLGIRVEALQYQMEGLETQTVPLFSIGGLTMLSPSLRLGAHFTNLHGAQLAEQEPLPMLLTAGIGLKMADPAWLYAALEKSDDDPFRARLGVDYVLERRLAIRLGAATQPFVTTGGLGLRLKQLQFDYAVEILSNLPPAHQLSITFQWPEKS